MRKELQFEESQSGFQAFLKPNGINFTAAFFILFFLLALAFSVYAIIYIYPSPSLPANGNIVFVISMFLVGILSLLFLLIVLNLTRQSQRIIYNNGAFEVIKVNPLWFNQKSIISRPQIERIKREKLLFSINNLWYAFLFHDHTAFHEDAEKFLVPHLFNNKKAIPFFEFAEDDTKDFIVDRIRERLD